MKTGIDFFIENPPLLGSGCALICASSAVDKRGLPVFQLIHDQLGPGLKSLWSLQHGFFNDRQDNMIVSPSFVHPQLQIPVLSLYADHLLPHDEWLVGIDTLIVDIQDIGTRVYTYTNHLVKLARFLSGKTIRWIVLDRPNPLDGLVLEGPTLETEYRSIVGEIAVPMRHALSAAEYLSLAVREEKLDIDLTVLRVSEWKRITTHPGIWTLPSPNMPTHLTAHVYPGAVLLEGTTISEGRGTTRPFELLGAPFIDAAALARHMNRHPFLGITAVPMHFRPEFSKFREQVCNGILCHQPNPLATRSFAFFYELIRWVRHRHPDSFAWKNPPYEFETLRLPIDMINGGPSLRLAVEENRPVEEWLELSEKTHQDFRERIADILLY